MNSQRHAQDALKHLEHNNMDAALRSFGMVLSQNPKDPQANFFVGMVAYQLGDLVKAEQHLKTAAPRAKKHSQTHIFLGLTYLAGGNFEGAKQSFQKAITLEPKNAELHALLGEVLHQQHRALLARQSYEKALTLEPENKTALIGLGQLNISEGKVEDARGYFEKAIATPGQNAVAFHRLAMMSSHKETPDYEPQLKALLDNPADQNDREVAYLHWAAGKINYDLGDTQQAIEHYRTARRTHYAPFDHDQHAERLAFFKEVFTKDFFEERKDVAHQSDRPVFIFGMPRSGTTLFEQIVARHSRAASGGEQRFFTQTLKELGLMDAPSAALEHKLKSLDQRDYARIARHYLKDLEQVDKRASRVTDKMPHNFEALWLMSLLFPNASFVHSTRCPADTCTSLLTHALSPAHSYARSQESVGQYFARYGDLMKHWEANLPVTIYEQNYEALVYDFDGEAKALLEASGLDWEDQCREFYRNENLVTTFSDVQVRRPIFKSSVGRWKRQKDMLTVLFEALGPWAPTEMGGKCALSEHYGTGSAPSPANDAGKKYKTA